MKGNRKKDFIERLNIDGGPTLYGQSQIDMAKLPLPEQVARHLMITQGDELEMLSNLTNPHQIRFIDQMDVLGNFFNLQFASAEKNNMLRLSVAIQGKRADDLIKLVSPNEDADGYGFDPYSDPGQTPSGAIVRSKKVEEDDDDK